MRFLNPENLTQKKKNWLAWAKLAYDVYSDRQDRKAQKNANNINQQLDNSKIQRTVEDAKKAGVHPLYALGSTATFTPMSKISHDRRVSDSLGQISRQDNEITRATVAKLNAETDFIKEQSDASKQARITQAINSQQDDVVELEKYKLPTYAQKSATVGKGGIHIKTPLGGLLYKNSDATAQQLEDQTGEIMAMIASTMNTAKAWGRFKALQAEARRKFPSKRNRRGRETIHTARQKNRRAHYLKELILFNTRGK